MSDERPSSLLMNSQREYIKGNREPSNPSQFRTRLRSRIEAGLWDLHLLAEFLEDQEYDKLFGEQYAEEIDPVDEAKGDIPESEIARAYVPLALQFFLKALDRSGEQIYPKFEEVDEEQPALSPFIGAVEEAIERHLRANKNYSSNVSVTIDLNELDPIPRNAQD
jgi:hypothetical protein